MSFSSATHLPHDRSAIRERRVAIFLLIVIVSAVYLPVVNQQFSGWDDIKYINAVWKPGWQRAWRIVTDFGLQYTGEVYYNPLHMLSLMADQLLSTTPNQPSAWIAKLMNVVYHGVNSILVFILLLMAGTGRRPAFIGALIFAVHPVQVGTVAWVAERKNLLATLFYVASVILFLKYLSVERGSRGLVSGAEGDLGVAGTEGGPGVTGTEAGPAGVVAGAAPLPTVFQNCAVSTDCLGAGHQPPEKRLRYLLGIALCLVASLLSKPSAVTLPVVLAAFLVVFGYSQFKGRRVIGLLAVLFVIALGWGTYVLLTERTQSGILPSWPYRPLIAAGAFWFYVSKLLVPVELAPIYPRWNVAGHVAWFSALLTAFLGISAIIVFFRKRIDKWILWAILFFAINLVLVSGIIPFGYMKQSFVSDHFLYLPMVGVALIVARALKKLFDRYNPNSTPGALLMTVIYLWVAVLGVTSVRQTWLWRDPLSMWEATYKANPMSFASNNNYGVFLMQRGEYDKALILFKKASELEPKLDVPYFNQGEVYRRTGDTVHAKKMYAMTIQVNPEHIDAWIRLAESLSKEGKQNEAIDFLKRSIRQNPRSGKLHGELGLFYYNQGKEEDSLKEFTEAIELDPLLPVPYIQKGVVLLSRHLPDEAIPLLKTAVTLAARADAHNVLGAAYAEKGEYRQALEEFRVAYKIQPGFPGLGDNIANAMIDLNDYEGAARFCADNDKLGMPCAEDTIKRMGQK